MKALLVQPVGKSLSPVPPLGLGYLAAVLEDRGLEVKIIDLNVESSTILEEFLSRELPELVGVSCVIGNARQAFAVANKVKANFPECFVVAGGPYASIMGEAMLLGHREIDSVVVGEGEVTFVELMERLRSKQDLDGVKGLIFRDGGRVKSNSSRDPFMALDGLPFPAREKLPMELYGENGGVLFTSRGCPYQCIFCSRSAFGKRWRGHSPEYVLKEIDHLRKHHGISNLSFLDDNFTYDLDRAEKILDGILAKKLKLSLYFWNGIRVDSVTKGLLLKMKRAGCTAINYGVESPDPEILARIKKDITLDQVEETIRMTREAGIRANVFLMIGNPGDSLKVVNKIKKFLEGVKVDGVHLSLATPIPGTEFWRWANENGHWLTLDQSELLDWPIDDVEDAYPVFETPEFTAEQRKEAFQETRKYLAKNKLLL
jgi:radical SAM superfamily enzyme YgiQ (UPF0313 family)